MEFPCLHMFGTSVPGRLYPAMSSGHILDGFLNRMVVVESHHGDVIPPDHDPDNAPCPDSVIDWVQRVAKPETGREAPGNLVGMVPGSPVKLRNDPLAKVLFDDFRKHVRKKLMDDDDRAANLWNRAWQHAAKIAIIVQLSIDPDSSQVSHEAASWAIRFVSTAISTMVEAIDGKVADTQAESNWRLVASIVKEAGESGCSRTVLSRKTQSLSSREREDALRQLVDLGYVNVVSNPTSGRGRPGQIVLWIKSN